MVGNIFFTYFDKKKHNKTFSQKNVLVCSMVFGGGPLNTLKLFLPKILDFFR